MSVDNKQLFILSAKSIAVKIGLVILVLAVLVFGWFSVRWQIGSLLADITSPNQENAGDSAKAAYNFSPQNPWANWLMASVEKESDPQYTEGFEKVVRLSPNDYRFWIQLGRAYEQAEKPIEAEKAFKRAIETAPNHTFPHWQIGNFYLRQDRDEEAFKELAQAAKDNSAYREQILSIAWDYYEKDAEKLEYIVGDSADVRTGLAKFYAAKERPKKSLEMWNSLSDEAKEANDETAKLIAQALFDKRYLLTSVEFVRQTGIEKNAKPESILNGSFEDNINDPDKVFFGWSVLPAEKMSVRISSFKKQEGKKSLQMSFTGFDKIEINSLYQTIAVKPNNKYQLSFWVKTENLQSAGTPKIEVTSFNDSKILASTEAFSNGTKDWKQYKVNFTVPAETEGVTVRTSREYCGDKCPIVGSFWYDNFNLVNLSNN